MDVSALPPFSNVECPKCGKHTRVKQEFGPYTLIRRHAIGGMSMVFVARDNTLDREVALKILSEEFSADERRITAFEEEARITASFSHPHVVRVLTTGRAFGRFYIAMELVPGGHFEHQIRERGKIPEVELLPLAIEVAQGLKAAHAAGLIHRDVKPGNILLDAEGHAKLVDFGLALVTQGGKAQAKELWATPYYVPPETIEGQAEDFRSDIYALGATLYHALSGKPSCGEERMATDILREAKKKVIPLSVADPEISAETCRIIERAMAYAPNERYGSYDEMIADLAVSLSHLKSGVSETIVSSAKRRAERKRQELISALVGVGAILAATGAALWWVSRPDPKPQVAAPTAVDVGSAPVAPDNSGEIARRYRDARAALAAKDFAGAAVQFRALLKNPDVQEPTRTWAGLEAVLAHYLDGRAADGRVQGRETLEHVRTLPDEGKHSKRSLPKLLGKLDSLPAMPLPEASEDGAYRLVSAMLAGLKNWEQGMLEPAAACFQVVVSTQLPVKDEWASVYQKFAADYLADHQVLGSRLFNELPPDRAGCLAAMGKLDETLRGMKTRGRARFNVRAWQLDLARRAKQLEQSALAPPLRPARPAVSVKQPELPELLARLAELTREFKFADAVSYLKALPKDPPGAKLSSLVAVAESAAVFVSDIERDLARKAVSAELPLKSGELMARVYVDATGRIIATSAAGQGRSCQWSDFSPDALIALHRVLVKVPTSETERLRRHECAVSFDWLAGNRERALSAAAVLSQSSTEFSNRWKKISAGLPK